MAYADWVTYSRVDVIYVTRHEFVDCKAPMYIWYNSMHVNVDH